MSPIADPPSPSAGDRVARVVAGHIPALDGLRGLAILLVLAHNLNPFESSSAGAGKLLRTAMNAGWIGVQLFFVLSGFLITGILLDTKQARNGYRAFLARRTLRIFPLYYAVLFLVFVVLPRAAPLLGLPSDLVTGRDDQIFLWLYVSNWVEPYGRGVALLPHFWSLAVEEQFYLVWPFVVRGLSRKALWRVTIAVALVAVVVRMVVRAKTGNVEAAYAWTVCRMDALAIGAIGALLVRSPRAIDWLVARRRVLGWVGSACLAATFVVTEGFPRTTFADQSIGYTAAALAFGLWIIAAVLRQARPETESSAGRSVWELGPLQAVGRYSYGMYIFHLPLHVWVGRRLLGESPSLALRLAYPLVATLATFILAMASYYALERPFLRLKRYFIAG